MSLPGATLTGMVAVLNFRTLADYASAYTLHVSCPACHRHAVLNPMQAAKVAGWHVTLPALKAALTCSACGHRGAQISVVSDGRPDTT